jgi:hypothetical protein
MQRPAGADLYLCDQVIIDRDSGRRTLVGLFEAADAEEFPTTLSFDVYAELRDGLGPVTLSLVVTHLESGDLIEVQDVEVTFPDPFFLVPVLFQVTDHPFDAPGAYVFEILADGEPVCHRRFQLDQSEGE